MSADFENKSIPERAVRGQAAVCAEVVEIVLREVRAGGAADVALSEVYRQNRHLGSRDRRLLSSLTFAVLRWLGWLPCKDTAPAKADFVLAWLLDQDSLHPAIRLLAGEAGFDSDDLSAFGGLDLQEKAAFLCRLTNSDRVPSPEELVPAWVFDHFASQGPRETWLSRMLNAFQTRPPVWLRLNGLRDNDVIGFIRDSGVQTTLHPLLREALKVDGVAPVGSMKKDIRMGMEIQDLASQCVGLVCDPAKGETWWDVCAGSGGKSLHLAALMKNSGRVTATEIRQQSRNSLRKRAGKSGLHSVRINAWDGNDDIFQDRLFDGVLVDAPCTGSGTWHRNPDGRWRTTEKHMTEAVGKQAKLLDLAADRTKAGGKLVYSVCSLLKPETENVMNAFLDRRHDFELFPFANPLTGEQTTGQLWIWPWEGECNGMFIVRMRRTE